MVISASAEGTSYALVQAMACGTSAVVTKAGDNGLAVGTWGQVVPARLRRVGGRDQEAIGSTGSGR